MITYVMREDDARVQDMDTGALLNLHMALGQDILRLRIQLRGIEVELQRRDELEDDDDKEDNPPDPDPEEDDPYPDEDDDRSMFADPGGNSALRAATPSNPRNLPCPTCKEPNRLTPKDRALGYQCDACSDALEQGIDRY
jgi:hypothetical protein